MPRRTRVALAPLLALVLLASAPCGCGRGGGNPRPNLLLVTVDTLRPDRLACYGGAKDVGSAICALAQTGSRYVWALSPAPSTAPAVASILTSRYPSYHGVTAFASTFLSTQADTLAEALAAAGYDTAAFVCNPVINRARNLQQGFAVYDDRMTRQEPNRPGFLERDAASVTDAALAWTRVARRPWFLWVHYQDPHGPYDPPGAPPAVDAPRVHRLPLLRDHSGRGGIPAYQQLGAARGVETYEARYVDEIRYLDEHVARLVAGVDAQGGAPGVLLTADHGEAFGEDGYWFAHGHSLGLDQIRVPLLWRPPGGGAATVIAQPVSTLDVAPTLLQAARVARPEAFQGEPLPTWVEPVRRDGGQDRALAARPLFSEHRVRAAVVAGDRYYARDRRSLDPPLPDRISGGLLTPLPPRTAALDPDGAAPRYRPVDPADEPLETVLQGFLDAAGGRTEPGSAEVPERTREELRALGYLE